MTQPSGRGTNRPTAKCTMRSTRATPTVIAKIGIRGEDTLFINGYGSGENDPGREVQAEETE